MRARTIALLLAATVLVSAPLGADAPPGQTGPVPADATRTVKGKAYQFERIADGVYYATSTGTMVTGCNVAVIVNDRDVLLVDTATSPAATRALLDDLTLITDKPVRYVVNTHFHYDHTDGNQVFGPGVEILAHDFVRTAITTLNVLQREPYRTSQLTNVPNRIATLQQQIAGEADATRRGALSQQLAVAQAGRQALEEIRPTPPTTTYSSTYTLHRGSREIQLLFLGRGHTQGDTFVFLPKERIVVTGDMMESVPAYMGDALFDEWISTLEAVKQLDFDIVLPGHGEPFRGKDRITGFQGYLTDLIGKAESLRAQGVSPEEAARTVDLTAHRSTFPSIRGPGVELRGMRRLYAWLAERAGTASTPDSVAAEVLAFERAIEAAVVMGDVTFVDAATAPTFTFTHGDGWTTGGAPLRVDSRADWMATVARAPYVSRALDSVKTEVHGDVVITYGRYVGRFKDADPGRRTFTVWYERVYAKRSGMWQYLSHRTVDGPIYEKD
jgi:glyoxylase-like metal-dependent hydrolase (beta-lactamase superfamily II)